MQKYLFRGSESSKSKEPAWHNQAPRYRLLDSTYRLPPPTPTVSKRRRKLSLSHSGSYSDHDDLEPPPAPDSIETDSRPKLTTAGTPTTPLSTDSIPGTDLRPSSDHDQLSDPHSSPEHARQSDPRSSPGLARSYDLCSYSDPARTITRA